MTGPAHASTGLARASISASVRPTASAPRRTVPQVTGSTGMPPATRSARVCRSISPGSSTGRWGLPAAVAGRREVVAAPPPAPAVEPPIPFTRASSGQRLAAAALGAANIAAVTTLASALAERGAEAALAAQGLGWVLPLVPWLCAYAAAYLLVPAVRWSGNGRLNSAIATRNEARTDAANTLRAPTRALAAKLGAARARADRVALRPEEAVFDSGSAGGGGAASPEALVEAELAEFDRKMGGGAGGGGRPLL